MVDDHHRRRRPWKPPTAPPPLLLSCTMAHTLSPFHAPPSGSTRAVNLARLTGALLWLLPLLVALPARRRRCAPHRHRSGLTRSLLTPEPKQPRRCLQLSGPRLPQTVEVACQRAAGQSRRVKETREGAGGRRGAAGQRGNAPVERQSSEISCAVLLDDRRNGEKNIASSSGWAVTSRIRSPGSGFSGRFLSFLIMRVKTSGKIIPTCEVCTPCARSAPRNKSAQRRQDGERCIAHQGLQDEVIAPPVRCAGSLILLRCHFVCKILQNAGKQLHAVSSQLATGVTAD